MKQLLIDTYKIKDLFSGLGQFSLNFASHLAEQNGGQYDLHFLLEKGSEKPIRTISGNPFVYTSLQKRYFPSFQKKPDLWHSLYQLPSFLPPPKTPWILTVHDLNFLHEKSEQRASQYLRRLQKNIRKADVITAISEYTKTVMQQHLDLGKKEVRVIHNGIAPNRIPDIPRPAFAGEEPFFFSVGIFNRKKNFHVLVPMMEKLSGYRLVIAGNNDTAYGREIIQTIEELKLSDRVILPGKISEDEKYWLYNNCEAFLFPSLAEGFGMPVIEAMKAGKPVFTTRHTSLQEIGSSHAFYFENFDADEMAKQIVHHTSELKNRKDSFTKEITEYAAKFNWENCMTQYIELYKSIV